MEHTSTQAALERQPSTYRTETLSGGNIFHDIGHWFSHELSKERHPIQGPRAGPSAGAHFHQQQKNAAAAATAAAAKACGSLGTNMFNRDLQNQENALRQASQSRMAQASEQVYDRNYGSSSGDAITPYA